jgi:phosphatidylethanolamine/phosphatidyl-N-methylethanolamine N-methyltransferase
VSTPSRLGLGTLIAHRQGPVNGASPVEAVYARLAPYYDLLYGVTLEPGRRRALARLDPMRGESILEVGVGTGLSTLGYPRSCDVVAIDLSDAMLDRARARLERYEVRHVRLCRMDAARLALADASFDAVYAPYVMNVVPDPVAVAREMIRVCRPDGRIVLLNHFTRKTTGHPIDWLLGRIASGIGVNWEIDLARLLRDSGLRAVSVEHVNVPRVSSVVVCRRA